MSGFSRPILCALLLAGAPSACRGPSELPPPTPAERQASLAAVQAYLPQGPGSGLVLWDAAAGRELELKGVRVGRVETARSRLFLVEGEGRDAEGNWHSIRFYVIQSGPIFVVDTAVIAAPSAPRFAP